MGYAYAELIAPAVIFDNPGISREDLVKKLEEAHDYSGNTHWIGLNLLAHDLNFKPSDQYLSLLADRGVDPYGLELLSPQTNLSSWSYPDPPQKFYVKHHLGNVLRKPRVLRIDAYNGAKIRKGAIHSSWGEDIYPETDTDERINHFLVEKIYKKRIDFDESDMKFSWNHYLARIVPIEQDFKTWQFDSLEQAYLAFPEYRPENIHDLEQKHGNFSYLGRRLFLWKQVDSKFYIDPITFDRIPASLWSDRLSKAGGIDFGYTDLVVTAEAIKYKTWSMLGRNQAYIIFNSFMDSHPDSKARYEKAVWDSHTSLHAKREKMTYTQLLRWRTIPTL